jgi:phage terminase small subunit
MSKLNPRQVRFVEEYLVDLNATQATIRAGYAARSAYSTGERLLRNAEIAAAIRAAQEARSRRTEITQDSVARELARIGFGDPRRVMSWGPDGMKLRPSGDLTDDEAAIVAEVVETRTEAGGTLRVKVANKVEALKLLGQHLGMFVDRLNVNGTVTLPAEWVGIQALIVATLDRFPEARTAVVDALAKAEEPGGGA